MFVCSWPSPAVRRHARKLPLGGGGLFGQPRGKKQLLSGKREIIVLRAGALHFRVDDGGGPCKVGFVPRDGSLITANWEFRHSRQRR